MQFDFNKFVKEYNLLNTNDRILLAMSGGVDSMVLGHLLIDAGYSLQVAHCNFQLRGHDSDRDEALVRKWCANHGIRGHFRKFNLQSAEKEKSVQEEAREVRYAWFQSLKEEFNLNKLATAHHATDNVETLFINLLRGSGMSGWSGIPLKFNNTVRPLLFATKEEILEYAKARNYSWREDQSNQSAQYLRNRIRQLILPVLEEIDTKAIARIAHNQQQLARDNELLERLLHEQNKKAFSVQDQSVKIVLSELQPVGFRPEVLFRLLQEFSFKFEQCAQILTTVENGKMFQSPTHTALVDRGIVIVKPKDSLAGPEVVAEIVSGQQRLKKPVSLSLSEMDIRNFEVSGHPHTAAIDAGRLKFPLKVRKWRQGDKFVPLGMKQQKLVSDFLIDTKVNRFDKSHVYVLESDEQIVWLIGHRIADWAKITPRTRKVLIISYE